MRLKIGFIVHDYNRFMGHSAYVVELASRFKDQHDVHVFADTFDESDSANITFHRVPALRSNAFASVLSFIPSAAVKVRGDFDVLHAQGLCGLRHDVATAHFCQAAWFAALQRESHPLSWKQRLFKSCVTPLERRALTQNSTRRVIAVSNRIQNDLRNYYHRSNDVRVIYHGVDSRRFNRNNRDQYRLEIRREAGVDSDDFVALYVGDLQKGARAAIGSLPHAPGTQLWCVTASDISDYRTLAGRLGVDDRVKFFPRTKLVEKYFAAADVFVFPTIYDPFGLVITEAMASGLPVITNREAGAAELISQEINGFLTSTPWNSQEIAIFLRRLKDDPRLRDRVGEAASTTASQLTWDRTAELTMAVYASLKQGDSLS